MEHQGASLEVRIEPRPGSKPVGGWPLECQVQVTDSTGQPFSHYAVTIPKLLSDWEESELSWYLESYAQDDIFAKSRSSAVEAGIKNYARKLGAILTTHDKGSDWLAGATLNVNVCAPVLGSSLIHALHWEVIESIAYWDETSRPSAVAVVRQLSRDDVQEPKVNDGQDRPTNILLVSARPQLQRDVPHRLASGVLVSVIESLPVERGNKVEAQFVRPGTFDNFTALLSRHGAGHFDTIHLDVHGIETDAGVVLVFLKQTTEGVAPDLIDGAKLAQVLVKHKVRAVIMNACRSATSRRTTESLVAELIKGGVDTVIGMSFDAIASSVERFLAALYDAHLRQGLSLPVASHAARLKLVQHAGKMTKYGNEVDVLDAMVPVCYVRGSASMSQHHTLSSERPAATLSYHPATNAKTPKGIYGRENDILLLETHFLGVSNVAILQGPAGIGKTVLLHYACDWWIKTGSIERAIYIELSEIHHEKSTWPGLQNYIRRALRISEDVSWNAVLERLKSHRYCLCIDGLEAVACLEAEARSTLIRAIKSLVKSLVGSTTCVLITSRRDEHWVSYTAYVHVLRGLSLAAAMQYVREVADEIGLQIPYHDQEQLQYLEQIIGLADYNPLVLYALIRELHRDTTSMRKFYHGLVLGSRRLLDLGWAQRKSGARSILELNHLLDVLGELPALDTMIDFAESAGGTNHAASVSRAKILEPLVKYGLTKESTCPIHFGLFWNRMAVGGLAEYIMFCSLEFGKIGGGSKEHMANVLAFSPHHEVAGLPKESRHMSQKAAIKELTPMIKLGYVSYRPELLSQDRVEMYYEIHPLLTLLSRNTAIHQVHFSLFARAFSQYHAYRIRQWPWACDYLHPLWVPIMRQASIEFTSNLCATLHALPAGYRSFAIHTNFKRLLWSIQKSLLHSVENQFIIVAIWGDFLKELEKFPHESFYSEDYEYQAKEILVLNGKETVPEIEKEEFHDTVLSFLHTMFYERVYLLGTMGMIHTKWKADHSPETRLRARSGLKLVLENILALTPAGRIKDQQMAEAMTKLRERNKNLIIPLEMFEEGSPSHNMTEHELLEHLRKSRERMIKAEQDVHGQAVYDPNWPSLFSRNNIDGSLTTAVIDSKSASSAAERLYQQTRSTVVSLWDIKEYEKVGAVLRDALHQAANLRGNYAATKVKLTKMLAKNFEKQGSSDDAYGTWAEVERLENGLVPKTVSTERLKRVIWLHDTAIEDEKPADSLKYMKRLVELANLAAMENEADIEQYAINTLAELEATKGLDCRVSTIFLLIRGAKVQHRRDNAGTPPRHWLARLLDKALDMEQLLEETPPDDKPQSILLANAAGLICRHLWALRLPGGPAFRDLMVSWQRMHSMDERNNRLSADIEERLFAGPGVEPGCRLLPASLRLLEHNALFEFMYVQGRVYLLRTALQDKKPAPRQLPEAPFAATDEDGGTQPPDYRFPTELMLKLAGYIIDW